MLAQVGNQGNVGNQNGNVVNENVQENVRNVLVNGNRVVCSYKEFLAYNPKEYDGKGGFKVVELSGVLMVYRRCCGDDGKKGGKMGYGAVGVVMEFRVLAK
nr:hypothetical protein [Tanacetum cinerariifolium]